MENTEKPAGTNAPIAQPRDTRWVRFVRYMKREKDERAAKKKEETPTDRVARVTAKATVWIAIFTFVSVAVSVGTSLILRSQLREMHDGGVDTHTLAEAAKLSADTQEHSLQMESRRAEDQEEAVCRLRSDGMVALEHIEHIRVINSGRVKARNIVSHVDVSLNDALTLGKIRDLGSVDISTSELDGGGQISSSIDRELNLPLTNRDWQNLADTNQVVINRGHIRYENGFGRLIDEPYCDGWWYFRTPDDKPNPIQGRGNECGQIPVNVSGIKKQKAK